MSVKYYVVGYADTRGEFLPLGVTKNKAKSERFKASLKEKLGENSRDWASIIEVNGI